MSMFGPMGNSSGFDVLGKQLAKNLPSWMGGSSAPVAQPNPSAIRPDQGSTGDVGKLQSSTPNVTQQVPTTASNKGLSFGSLGLFGSGHKNMLENVHEPSPDANQTTESPVVAQAPFKSNAERGLPEDAPDLTEAMSDDDKVTLAQAYLARRNAEGAFKSKGISAEQVQAGAKSVFEASKTTIGGAIGKGIDEVAGVNAVAHAQNALLLTQIGAAATARLNPINIARQEAARVDNRIRSKQLHSSVEDFKDNKGEGFLSSLPASGEERKAGSQALMDTHGPEEFKKRYQESKANKALMGLGQKLSANNRLLKHDKKMGGETLAPWDESKSVGPATPEHMDDIFTPGHTVAASDVVASTMKGNFNRVLASANPMSDRPWLNDAKLDDEQKMRLDTYHAVNQGLTEKASDDKAERKALKAADPASRGYRPDELTRRDELKGQLSDLKKVKDADRAKRMGIDKIHLGYAPGEKDALKGHDEEMSKIVDPYRKAQLAPHEAVYNDLHKHTVPEWKRSFTSGMLPEAETRELSDSQAELKKHTANGKSADFETQLRTEHLTARIKELNSQKYSGLTPEQYSQKKSAKAEIDRLKKASASELNLSAKDQASHDHHQSSKDDIEFQRTHGLNRQQKEAFDAATEERTAQKATRDTGLTDGERELKDFVHEKTVGVYEEAQTGRAFVNEHAGKVVSPLGRVGGLDSSDAVSEDKMAVTTAGRAAQMTRTAGSVVSGTGDALNASKKNIQKAIDDGKLLKASAQLAGSVTGDVLATTGNVQIPGIGTVSKQGLKSVGKALQGGGKVLHALGDSAAQDQDQRDRQRELTSGERLAATHKHAVDFGKLDEKKPSLVSEVTGGLKGISDSGLEPIDDLKENLSNKASSAANELADSAGEAVSHSTQALRSMPSDVTHAISDSVEMPHLTTPHVDLHQMSVPQMPPTESLSLETPSLKHLSAPALPIVAPALTLPELAAPEFTKSAEHGEETAPPAIDTEHGTTGDEHAGRSADFTLSEPQHTFLTSELGSEGSSVHDPAEVVEGRESDVSDKGDQEKDDDDRASIVSGDGDQEELESRPSNVSDKDDQEEEEEEEDERKSEAVKGGPVKDADDEGPGGVTHHDNFRPLIDRLATTPTPSQVIKNSASNAWSSVKNAFGFGKKDNLDDHIGTARRDRSVKPMLDRLSASQSLSARLGRGASRAWSSIKGFFGARQAPAQTPEEDNLASHIGDNIRPRRRAPKI